MTAADQPPDEWVERAARGIFGGDDRTWRTDPGGECARHREATARALTAVWPLVQAMVRDAKVETLDEAIRRYDAAHIGPPGAARSMLAELRREVQS